MRESGIGDPQPTRRASRPAIEDGRWTLIRDLVRAAHDRWGWPEDPDFEPIGIRRPEVERELIPTIGISTRLVIAVDNRVPVSRLIDWLRREWPALRREGFVRRTRSFADRTLALIRFVCLEAEPDSSWRARWEAWNERNPGAWSFPSPRAFTTAFQRAERNLTGRRFGLDRFYDSASNLWDEDPDEFLRRVRSGDPDSIRIYQRHGDPRAGYKNILWYDRFPGDEDIGDIQAGDGEARE